MAIAAPERTSEAEDLRQILGYLGLAQSSPEAVRITSVRGAKALLLAGRRRRELEACSPGSSTSSPNPSRTSSICSSTVAASHRCRRPGVRPCFGALWGRSLGGEFNYLRIWVSRLRRKLGAPVGSSGPIRAFQGIGYLLDSHWTPETEGGLGEEPDPVTGAATEPGAPEADTDPEPVEVGRPED